MTMGSREMMAEGMDLMKNKSLEELKTLISDANASPGLRSASAVILLKKARTVEDKAAALPALGIRLPLSATDWESNWKLNYPVAEEVCNHSDLMPLVIKGTLDGSLPEDVVGFVLLHYQSANVGADTYLDEFLKGDIPSSARHQGERLVAILKGQALKNPPVIDTAVKPLPAPTPTMTQPSPPMPRSNAMTWSTIIAFIVVVVGLPRLLFKLWKSYGR